jgi:3-methyladenine DNA glycosylase AlkD
MANAKTGPLNQLIRQQTGTKRERILKATAKLLRQTAKQRS